MDEHPRVSVLIPTRDRASLLRASVESALCQTRAVDQIVVVDDASTTWDPSIAALSPIIEVVRRPHAGGPAAARNAALARATGAYVVFLDDDDLLAPRFVERGLSVLAANPDAGGVFFRYRTIVSGCSAPTSAARRHQPLPFVASENPVDRVTLESRPVTAFLRYLVPIHSGLLRRSSLGDRRFPEAVPQGEDTYFWISLAAAGQRFVLDEHPYALVRRHDGNLTRSRVRYVREIQPCYRRLLNDGLLANPEDAYLAHLKLLWFGTLTGGGEVGRHLHHVVSSPQRLARELGFWSLNLLCRHACTAPELA